MHSMYFVRLHVVFILVNAYVNGLGNQTSTYFLCTEESDWRDTIATCLLEGGRPLTHDDIKMANVAEKINFTVWTAEYTERSEPTRNTSEGLDLLSKAMCASQTVYLEKRIWGLVTGLASVIKYKNCTEQLAYICYSGIGSDAYLFLNKTTWMNAETLCNSKNRHLSQDIYLLFDDLPVVVTEQLESMTFDVWIGLVASLVHRTAQRKTDIDNLRNLDIVTYGTYSSSEGYRMIYGNLPDRYKAFCRFEGLKSVRQSLFTDCTKVGVTHTGEITPKNQKDISTSSEDELSKTTIKDIGTATIAFIIGCIVSLFVLFVYKRCHIRTEANLGTVQFVSASPSTVKLSGRRNEKNADRASDHNKAEVEANYEAIPDNIQPVYVNEREECLQEVLSSVNHLSVYVNKTPEANYEVVPDSVQSVYVNETGETGYEALLPVNQDSVYVNKTPEGYYEKLATNNTESV